MPDAGLLASTVIPKFQIARHRTLSLRQLAVSMIGFDIAQIVMLRYAGAT